MVPSAAAGGHCDGRDRVGTARRPGDALFKLQLRARPGGDLSPIAAPDAPGELMALVDATNAVVVGLDGLLE